MIELYNKSPKKDVLNHIIIGLLYALNEGITQVYGGTKPNNYYLTNLGIYKTVRGVSRFGGIIIANQPKTRYFKRHSNGSAYSFHCK